MYGNETRAFGSVTNIFEPLKVRITKLYNICIDQEDMCVNYVLFQIGEHAKRYVISVCTYIIHIEYVLRNCEPTLVIFF